MKKNNPSVIGLFVIGSATILMAAIALFSNQDFFTPKREFVIYFQQSVNGLHVGAPVRFRGIPVGEVIEIDGLYDPQTGIMIPRIKIEFRPETLEGAVVHEGEYTLFPALLANGIRASLKSASLLTGQLYVALEFQPDTPERYLGSGNDEVPEMPSHDSGFDEALAKLSELPVEEVLVRASGALSAAEDLMRNPDVRESLKHLPVLLQSADETMIEFERFVNRDLSLAARDASKLLVSTTQSVDELAEILSSDTLSRVAGVLIQIEETVLLARTRLEKNDPLMVEMQSTLTNIRKAARAVRDLAESIEEQPESLLRGKASE